MWNRVRLTWFIIALAALPTALLAQGQPQQSLTIEHTQTDIREALRALFQEAGISYSLDKKIQGPITVALRGVSFRTALETILRAHGEAPGLTYRVEDGVYNISPKGSFPGGAGDSLDGPQHLQSANIFLNFVSADSAIQALRQLPISKEPGISVQRNPARNGLIVSYTDENTLRELKQALAMMDIEPRVVQIKAEAIVVRDRGMRWSPSRSIGRRTKHIWARPSWRTARWSASLIGVTSSRVPLTRSSQMRAHLVGVTPATKATRPRQAPLR